MWLGIPYLSSHAYLIILRADMTHFIYRSTWKDGKKKRPDGFSKSLSLYSFIRSLENVTTPKTVTFFNDGDMPEDRLALMRTYGTEVIQTGGIGNSASYNAVLDYVKKANWDGNDLVVFQEDDYLFTESALVKLIEVASIVGDVDYFTLYDHPDRYIRTDDKGLSRTRIYWAGDHHWRIVESTCMSFASRFHIILQDMWIHRLFSKMQYPRDRKMWYCVQGLGVFAWKWTKHRLISPIRSLSTHMESEFLAPGIDWAQELDTLKEWMAEHNYSETS